MSIVARPPLSYFSFSKYSFAVPLDVYLEYPPNIQLVETSPHDKFTHRELPFIISSSSSYHHRHRHSFIASRTRLYITSIASTLQCICTQFICIHAPRTLGWTEQGRGSKRTARGVVLVEGNMGGSHSIKIWGIERLEARNALMKNRRHDQDRQRVNTSDEGEKKERDTNMETFP